MAEEAKAEEIAAMTANKEVPQISAGDLATMVRIIDAGSQRGSFKGEEMETVGALRNKLATVVNALAPKPEETKETEEGGVEVEADATEKITEEVTSEDEAV